jgi:hypothetical protein
LVKTMRHVLAVSLAAFSLVHALPVSAAVILSVTCRVDNEGFWENGNRIPPSKSVEDKSYYMIALWPDGLTATFDGRLDFFVNCAVSEASISCRELKMIDALPIDQDEDVSKTIDLDRKTGKLHAAAWLKSKPEVRRDSRGICTVDQD